MDVPLTRCAALATVLSLFLAGLMAKDAGAALGDRPDVVGALSVLDVWLEEQIASGVAPGFSIAIVHDQEVVWSDGYGFADLESRRPATPETLYRLGSVTKLLTATAILQLRDAGKLALDDPVSRHLPEFTVRNPFPGTPAVTLRHLLTQTSGLPRDAPFAYWTTHVFPSREQLLASLDDLELTRPPGETYKYSNLGMGLLGLVIERVSGLSYAEYLRGQIFMPLGMSDSTAAPTDEHHRRRATSYYRKASDGSRRTFDYYDMEGLTAAGNVVSSVEDLAEFAKLQFRDGAAGGKQILAGATVREMQRAQFVQPSFESGRGLGFAVSRSDGVTFVAHGGWIGGNRTHFLLVPSQKIAVMVAANADDADPSRLARRAYDTLAPAIVAATASPPALKVADPKWRTYVGTYTDPWDWEYEVMIVGEELVFYEHSYPPADDPTDGITRLVPVSEHTFRMPDGEPVVFEIGADGKVERVRRRFEYLTPVE
jgi:CubicO group peptidase (beta-lactamase class C family)